VNRRPSLREILNQIAELSLADLQVSEVLVLAFLEHLEKNRERSIGTRNCRLAARARPRNGKVS
jgi:hypothetical protein